MGRSLGWDCEQKRKIASFIAVEALALQSCVLHIGSLFKGVVPIARAEELAREKYRQGAVYSSFSSLQELLTHLRNVIEDNQRERCAICSSIEQERSAGETAALDTPQRPADRPGNSAAAKTR